MSEIGPTAISRPRPPDLVPGYRLQELVGKGGMGEVHRALQLSLERKVAVKLLAQNLAQDPGFVARFEKEAAALAQLSHPNIVSIVDKGKAGETYYLVMEFVQGPSLRELWKNGITGPAALRAVLEVGRAIDYAHGRGIVHRDLKPENILIDAQAGNIAKVSDFGLAGFLDDGAGRFNVTATHVAMGTLAYMAPEQRVDAKTADHRADIYSLGVMLYELLTGDVPMGSYAPPSTKKPELDARVDRIVERCLKPDPGDRYQKASELLAELEPLVNMATIPPPSLTSWDRFALGAKRVGKTVGRVTGSLLVLAAMGVLAVAAVRNSRPLPPPELPAAIFEGELPALSPRSLAARVEQVGLVHRVRLGEGSEYPDQLTVLPEGRAVIADAALSFEKPDATSRVGRVAVDLVEVEGQAARLDAFVSNTLAPPDFRGYLRRTLLGEAPEPRAAVTLLGTPGRHATVVLGSPGTPVALEWVFGARRGVMLGPPSPPGATTLALEVDFAGDLRAFVGNGPDRRPVGEPVSLGKTWRTTFGRLPSPQFGCADGACRFSNVTYEVEVEPPPPAPPPPMPAVLNPPEPPPVVATLPVRPMHVKREKAEHPGALKHPIDASKSVVTGKKSDKPPEKSPHHGRQVP